MSHERHLCVGECSNFRDIGGYLTEDKKWKTRWNRLYRSDHLAKIKQTEDNLQQLCENLKVKASVDFRGEDEKKAEPYRIPGVETTEIPIEPGNIMHTLMTMREVREAAAVDVMVDLNELFVTQFQPQYRQFLKLVIANGAASTDSALVFHCTAGKDRTGYAAALILLLLGVGRDTVFEDYLLTNQYFKPPPFPQVPDRVIEKAALEALFFVRREFLEKALNTIDTRYGGVENYAKNELGITDADIEQLKAAYLEPA